MSHTDGNGYLERSKMQRVEGVVYCFTHDAVHEDTGDPHGMGYNECKKRDWRPLYASLRKGDYPFEELDGWKAKEAESEQPVSSPSPS